MDGMDEDIGVVSRTAAGRRRFLRNSAVALGGAALVGACTGGDGEAAPAAAPQGQDAAAGDAAAPQVQAAGESVFDKIRDGGTVRLGVDLTFPPLQFKTDAGEPTGYSVDLARRMMEDLGAEVEFVEVPFAELFPALAAGRFDFSGIAATNLPTRAQQVMFASEPLFIESNVVLVGEGSGISSPEDLNTPDVTLAVLVGSAQEASARVLFPEAEIKALDQQPAVQDAATGRSDAVLLGEFNVAEVLETNPTLSVLEGPALFADINTFFMPIGDFRMQAYVDNWLRYNTIRGALAGDWERLVAGPAREQGISSTPVLSPYLGAAAALDGS